MTSLSTRSMTGKTVLITGLTGGIGTATAVGLAALGARMTPRGNRESPIA